ncbi:MAG: pyridoxal-phosphate dependent enzyme [Spirochaetaceae bacterium]|nr:pyridoxal-phosphate dependent enzyme [Spirochaetaceae bacterium]
MDVATLPTIADVRAAAERIRPHVHATPVFTSRYFDRAVGASLFFKCENLQKVGAFKSRGACNAVFSLPDHQAAAGVATHSSGNHGQAVAFAAGLRGIPATVVMPRGTTEIKRRAVQGYGARTVESGPTLAEREGTTQRIADADGAHVIHPYDDADVVAGQGTVALELMQQAGPLDALLVPVGGGGLTSGTVLASGGEAGVGAGGAPVVYAAEPELADDAYESLRTGVRQPERPPHTVAEGLRTSLGDITFPLVRDGVREILLVDDREIVAATLAFITRTKLLIEPSAGVVIAALLRHRERFAGSRVGVVLTGGNVDLAALGALAEGIDG